MKFGDKLVVLRSKHGYSQVKLSDMSGVPQTTISTIENGATPNVEIASKLAKALNIKLEELIEGC